LVDRDAGFGRRSLGHDVERPIDHHVTDDDDVRPFAHDGAMIRFRMSEVE
jgi:hypothetical protein